DLRVGIDESYLARFSQADMLPAPESVTSGHIEVAIPPLRAGEQAHVRVRLEAGDGGNVDGAVRVNNGEHAPLASLKVSTWVLP
ncbi:MAG TPA: hypothetical protein VFY22_07880, partial [Hydrogenophaga sp.]|nr:hypothetical protein [Hydrogenophaga sp.]